MTARAYGVCSDVLLLAAKFPLAPTLPPAPELRQRLLMALDTVVGKGRAVGISDPDLAEMRYALVAFIDAQLLKSNWPGRAEWMREPLEIVIYKQFTAGEGFFVRMRNLLNDANRPDALAIYALGLLLGFRGQYGASGDEATPQGFLESARQQLARALPRADRIAPHAEPGQRAKKRKSSNAPLVAFIVGGLLLAVGCVIGLERMVHSDVEHAVDALPVTVPTGAAVAVPVPQKQ